MKKKNFWYIWEYTDIKKKKIGEDGHFDYVDLTC